MIDVQAYMNLNKLYADYVAAVDAKDWAAWVELFAED